jgi:cell division protein FtsL
MSNGAQITIDLGRAKLFVTLAIAVITLAAPALNVWLELRQLRADVTELRATVRADHDALLRIEGQLKAQPPGRLTSLP